MARLLNLRIDKRTDGQYNYKVFERRSTQEKENEMDIVCSTYVEMSGTYRIWWGMLRERGHLEEVGLDWKIILKWFFK
jgi:hypothetical protein